MPRARLVIAVERCLQRGRDLDLARRVVAVDDDLDLVALGDARLGPERVRQPEHGLAAVDHQARAERHAVDGAGDRRARLAPQRRASSGTTTWRSPQMAVKRSAIGQTSRSRLQPPRGRVTAPVSNAACASCTRDARS